MSSGCRSLVDLQKYEFTQLRRKITTGYGPRPFVRKLQNVKFRSSEPRESEESETSPCRCMPEVNEVTVRPRKPGRRCMKSNT